MPYLKAFAFIVVLLDTVIGLLYIVLLLVGVVPFVVYLMVAPVVAQLSVTDLGLAYVPGATLDVGVDTGIIT